MPPGRRCPTSPHLDRVASGLERAPDWLRRGWSADPVPERRLVASTCRNEGGGSSDPPPFRECPEAY